MQSVVPFTVMMNVIMPNVIMLGVVYSNCRILIVMLNVIMPSVVMLGVVYSLSCFNCYAECRYAKCHHA
jgi:hypothetical protein